MTRAPAELRLVADRAARTLGAAGAPEPGDGVAVAVSGGADSLALLHALGALAGPRRWRLAVVTVDHGMRPGSAADAAFVADHAKALGLPARVCTLTPGDLARHRPAGPEGAARAARYEALWPAADELGCPWLATGHTLDDQAETVLLQLLRGAGPDGLAAMAVRSGRLLRPLLAVRGPRPVPAAPPPGWPGARTRPTPATGRCATGSGTTCSPCWRSSVPAPPRPWPAPPPWPPTSATGSTPWSPPPWPGLWTAASPPSRRRIPSR